MPRRGKGNKVGASSAKANASSASTETAPVDPLAAYGYTTLEEIGRGTFGVVVKAKAMASGDIVAVKTTNEERIPGLTLSAPFKELGLTLSLKHPNVVQLRKHFLVESPDTMTTHFVMEYCPCDLSRKMAERLLSERVWKYLAQIMAGIAYVHERNIIHRDLKPANILVSSRDEIKIADFGAAHRNNARKKMELGRGTRAYCAPELLGFKEEGVQHGHYGYKVDMWSVGCILVEMVLGGLVFKGCKSFEELKEKHNE
ncbi:cyclin-dependent serine/threonine protein kinase [Geranomyces michiganensis]|nr:cyclin-dependent serine/threonine protein kinase [Geranomyces michiganensis]